GVQTCALPICDRTAVRCPSITAGQADSSELRAHLLAPRPTNAARSSGAAMHLRTLGTLALAGADFSHPKLLLLLSYLSLTGPQPRGRLARLFWPEATDARNRLSVSL